MDVEFLKTVLAYAPDTGVFTWIGSSKKYNGKRAGSLDRAGYRVIRICGIKYFAHRLAWLYVNGDFPMGELDHIDGVRDGNQIHNLRTVTRSQNMLNPHILSKRNSSGHHGCFKIKGYERWRAEIKIDGKRHFLGSYPSPELAGEAYKKARVELMGG